MDRVGTEGEALLILEGDPVIAQRHGLEPEALREDIYLARRRRVNQIVKKVVEDNPRKGRMSNIISKLMLRPSTGIPFLLLSLWAMYQLIGVFIAGTVVDFLEEEIFGALYEPAVSSFISRFIAEETALSEILIGEFGLLTMTLSYIFAILLPLVIGFYFFLSIFEDSGYLPRIAALVDRALNSIGLNGRAVIPLILGLGCVTMGTIVTRLLGSERERRIAIFLLALSIPCSAQIGVITGILAGLGWQFAISYILVTLAVFIAIGNFLHALLPGKSTDLIIDLPPLRFPRVENILKKTVIKSYQFIKEAFPLFALGALIISNLHLTGVLEVIQRGLSPLTVGWLKLPAETSTAFIMGIVRRDFAAAGLAAMALTPVQSLVSLITITLFVPCIASVLIIFKERSKKEAALMWVSTWIISFLVGGLTAQIISIISPGEETNGILLASVILSLTLVFSAVLCKVRLKSSHLRHKQVKA